MLTSIREKTQGIIAGIIVGAIILVFALWGVNSYFEGGSTLLVAYGDDIEISQREFRNILEGYRSRVSAENFDNPFFKEQVLNSLVDEKLVVQNLHDQGYRVGDEVLTAKIKVLPYFQRDNKFDSELYKTSLRARQINTRQYEEQMRNSLVIDQITNAYSDSAMVTNSDRDEVLRLMLQSRTISTLTIHPDKFRSTVKVSKDEVSKYYESNGSRYMEPEKVRIEYLTLSADKLAREFEPTLEELKAAYENSDIPGIVTPARRRASHILIELANDATPEQEKAARSKIDAIAKQIREGKSFAELARTHSQDGGSAKKGGDLGYVKSAEMVKPFIDALFALNKQGQVSKVVRSRFGFHLIKLTAYTPEKRKTFAEVKQDIAKQLRKDKSERRFYDMSTEFYNLVYENPDSLQPAADALGLKVKKSTWFSRQGGPGIAADAQVLKAAFSNEVLEEGRNSEGLEIDDSNIVAIRILERRPAKQKPLKDLQAQIRTELHNQKAAAKVAELQTAIMKELDKGSTLFVLGRKYGLKQSGGQTIVRGQTKSIDQRVINAVFAAPRPDKGKAVHGSVPLGNRGYVIYSLTAVNEGEPARAKDADKKHAQDILTARWGSEQYSSYRAGLRKAVNITLRPENF